MIYPPKVLFIILILIFSFSRSQLLSNYNKPLSKNQINKLTHISDLKSKSINKPNVDSVLKEEFYLDSIGEIRP